jgi:hypothetical protein
MARKLALDAWPFDSRNDGCGRLAGEVYKSRSPGASRFGCPPVGPASPLGSVSFNERRGAS